MKADAVAAGLDEVRAAEIMTEMREYAEALGGRLRVVADFGDAFIVVQG